MRRNHELTPPELNPPTPPTFTHPNGTPFVDPFPSAQAVVPCCVFPGLHPHRTTLEGGPVRSYEELISYLLAKCGGVKEATLPTEGRNRVVYWHPPAQPALAPSAVTHTYGVLNE